MEKRFITALLLFTDPLKPFEEKYLKFLTLSKTFAEKKVTWSDLSSEAKYLFKYIL